MKNLSPYNKLLKDNIDSIVVNGSDFEKPADFKSFFEDYTDFIDKYQDDLFDFLSSEMGLFEDNTQSRNISDAVRNTLAEIKAIK